MERKARCDVKEWAAPTFWVKFTPLLGLGRSLGPKSLALALQSKSLALALKVVLDLSVE